MQMPQNPRCCAYLRKSRKDEQRERADGYDTLSAHRAIIERLAASNGHEIAAWHEEVVSGETIDGRPEMRALMQELADGEWDAVYVVEASRLGRGGGSDQEKIVNAFRYTGTWLFAEFDVYDPSSMQDMKSLKRELRSSEDELEMITTRLTRGKYQASRDGWWVSGRCPCGWKAERAGNGRFTLVPDPATHQTMRRIFREVIAGCALSAIAKRLNAEHVPTPRGGVRWTPASIRAIVTNPAHCGYVTYGKNRSVREMDRETFAAEKRTVRVADYMQAKGRHWDRCQSGEWGVTEEEFDAAQLAIANNPRVKYNRKLSNPLSGVLVCGCCGYSMSWRIANGRPRYEHKARAYMTRECPDRCTGASASDVIDAVCDALGKTADVLESSVSGDFGARRLALESRLRDLETAATRADSSVERLTDAYLLGAMSPEEYRDRRAALESSAEDMRRELSRVSAAMPDVNRIRELTASVRDCIALLQVDGDAREKNRALKRVVERIGYSRDGKGAPIVLDVRLRM